MWHTREPNPSTTFRMPDSYTLRTSMGYDGEQTTPENISSNWRTYALLLDYKQFKAARLIQKMFRGWQVRSEMKERDRAARSIQKYWRCYRGHRLLVVDAEERAQQETLELYQRSARKIQAVFRGWWSRKYINNMLMLKEIQLIALDGLLRCMIYEMHHIEGRDQLPGILSFRDEVCLSKIEGFMSTLTYRFFNRIVVRKWMNAKATIDGHREEFAKSEMYSWAPYAGFRCAPKMPKEIIEKKYDSKQDDIVQTFLKTKYLTREQYSKHYNKMMEKRIAHLQEINENRMKFCQYLLYSIKRWKVVTDGDIVLSEKKMRKMGMQKYLMEVKGFIDAMYYVQNCNCIRDTTRYPRVGQ